MSKILIVIPFYSGNSQQTEMLVDFIYQLNGKKSSGYALLVASNEVHAEPREKIKISASLAFESYEMIQLGKVVGDKDAQIAATSRAVLKYVEENYKVPFLWLEPDCTPVKKEWVAQLESTYEASPKRYLGNNKMRAKIYPNDATNDFGKSINNPAIDSGLIAEIVIESDKDIQKVPADAALCHSDKKQILLKSLRSKIK